MDLDFAAWGEDFEQAKARAERAQAWLTDETVTVAEPAEPCEVLPPPTWFYLDRAGEWGAKVHGPCRAGDVVRVVRRDGSSSDEEIRKILWSEGGVSIVRLVGAQPAPRFRRGRRG